MRRASLTMAIGFVLLAGCGGSRANLGPVPRATVVDPAAAGSKVFTSASAGCSGCHAFAAAGSSGTIGPNLDTHLRPDAEAAGKQLEPFVYDSIVSPTAYVAQGFPRNVMPRDFAETLTKEQLAELVAFITANVRAHI